MIEITEIAWAAGFYDGEGSSKKVFYHYKSKKGLSRVPNTNVMMSVPQADLEPLERFKRAVNNLGRINGPYQYGANKRPYWVWSASCKAANEAFDILKPFLGSTKRLQFDIVSKEVKENKTRKKGWVQDEKAKRT